MTAGASARYCSPEAKSQDGKINFPGSQEGGALPGAGHPEPGRDELAVSPM